MLGQKLRPQRGWSQEDLADLGALSVRAIRWGRARACGRRRGDKALAAVFEVCFLFLKESDTSQPSALSVERGEAVALAPRARDQAL